MTRNHPQLDMRYQSAMILVAALVGATTGCIGPDYYLTAETVTYAFTNDAFDETRARAGLEAAGFRTSSASTEGSRANDTAYVRHDSNGTFELGISYYVGEKLGKRERAEERGLEIASLNAADAADIISAFEGSTGWRHDKGPTWSPALLHGD